MKYEGFDFSLITPCGECCITCAKKENDFCKGCIETDGYCKEAAKTGRCDIYACAELHNVKLCSLCYKFPCIKITTMIYWKPNLIERLRDLEDIYEHYRRTDEEEIK